MTSRSRGRRDPVSPELYQQILERDQGCIAPIVDLSQLGTCSPHLELEHVKSQLRIGKRAPSRPDHLVTLCTNHTEQGMKAGHVWNSNKQNRELVRMYLEWINDTSPSPGSG